MKNGQPEHYWRIHARVTRRVWGDLPESVRHVIASDEDHTSREFAWFNDKVNEDTGRLFTDSAYYDNQPESFQYPRHYNKG